MSNIIEMKSICKSFGAVKALKNIDFAVRAGETMALVGENGAGKSTLMKLVAGHRRLYERHWNDPDRRRGGSEEQPCGR